MCGAELRYICMQELQIHCIRFSLAYMYVKGSCSLTTHVLSKILRLLYMYTVEPCYYTVHPPLGHGKFGYKCFNRLAYVGFIKGQISISCCYFVIKISVFKVNIHVLTVFNSTFQFQNSLELCFQLSESAIFWVNSTCGYQTVIFIDFAHDWILAYASSCVLGGFFDDTINIFAL